MRKLEIKNCNVILTEKQQNYLHIIWKVDIYEYVAGEEILPSNQT